MSGTVKIDYRDLKKVTATAIRASKAQSSAMKSEGYRLKKEITTGMKAQHPGGETWPKAHPWTAMGLLRGRYVKRTRKWGRTSMTWTERRKGGAKALKTDKTPLAKLANAVRYKAQEAGGAGGGVAVNVRIGFLTSRAAKLAEYHATGGTMPVTSKMRRLIYAAGLSIHASSIKVPKRRHVEPVYEQNKELIAANVSKRVADALNK
jgi:hypothetical protein